MAGGRLYMQIQIPEAFPLTLPFCSGRTRKNCGVCVFFYLFLYVSCALWFSLISYFIIFPVLFPFCGYICGCIFSFICLLCLELSPKSFFSFQPDMNKHIEASFFSPCLSTSLPLLLPYLFPFPPTITIFSSAFFNVFLSYEFSCSSFDILHFTSGETWQGFGPFFP